MNILIESKNTKMNRIIRKHNVWIMVAIIVMFIFGVALLFNNIKAYNLGGADTISDTELKNIAVLQQLDNLTSSSQLNVDRMREEANYILANRIPNGTSCSTITKINEKEGWNQYSNDKFRYILKYPAYLFELKEYSECAYAEFVPTSLTSDGNYASVYEYYVRVLAITTDSHIRPQQWAADALDFNVTASSVFRNVYEISIENTETIEVGPIPGQVEENFIVISTTDTLFEIVMYPAPIQPGQKSLPSNTTWSSNQQMFIEEFYQMLNSFHRF